MSYRQKSFAAFKISMESLTVDQAYMWTFTWPTVADVKIVRRAWNRFLNGGSGLLRCFPTVSGLRVFEMHPGEDGEHSHGLHIHCVVNQRLSVDIVRIIAQRAGFGRIHVKRVKERKHALYLSKYLRKQDRTEALVGCRLWAAFGHEKGARVADIEVHGRTADAWRYAKAMIGGWCNIGFGDKTTFVESLMGGSSLEECFESIGYKQLTEPSWALQFLDEHSRESRAHRARRKFEEDAAKETGNPAVYAAKKAADLRKFLAKIEREKTHPF